jgi:hypothetical protein
MANPTYPQVTITPHLGLNLTGMDVLVAMDFLILDTFIGALVGSVALANTMVGPITSNYTAAAGQVVLANTAAGGFTITLPAAALNKGNQITIKKISTDGNTLTIAPTGADLLDGQTLQSYSLSWTAVTFISDGVSNWYVI